MWGEVGGRSRIIQKKESHVLFKSLTILWVDDSHEAEFSDEIRTKVFLLAIHNHLYSFASRFLFIQTHATS
jgi:hypothetical protein